MKTGPVARRIKGAMALEYVLLLALVALSLVAVFQAFGKRVAGTMHEVAEDSEGALRAP